MMTNRCIRYQRWPIVLLVIVVAIITDRMILSMQQQQQQKDISYNNVVILVQAIRVRKRYQLLFGSSNPCYVNQRTQPSAETCEDIVLPNNFCQTCNVGIDIAPTGEYKNCLYTSDVQLRNGTINMECLSMMDRYVALNPCDTHRKDAISNFRSTMRTTSSSSTSTSLNTIFHRLRTTKSRQILDSFVYAVCEAACDCIPQYNTSKVNRWIDIHRGNCQGHIYYDVCQVYPNIKRIRPEYNNNNDNSTDNNNNNDDDIANMPPVCPMVTEWRKNTPGKWFDLTPTTVDDVMKTFILQLMDATQIISSSSYQLWNTCYYLESTQKRIVPEIV